MRTLVVTTIIILVFSLGVTAGETSQEINFKTRYLNTKEKVEAEEINYLIKSLNKYFENFFQNINDSIINLESIISTTNDAAYSLRNEIKEFHDSIIKFNTKISSLELFSGIAITIIITFLGLFLKIFITQFSSHLIKILRENNLAISFMSDTSENERLVSRKPYSRKKSSRFDGFPSSDEIIRKGKIIILSIYSDDRR